jgi:hypothetical protein
MKRMLLVTAAIFAGLMIAGRSSYHAPATEPSALASVVQAGVGTPKFITQPLPGPGRDVVWTVPDGVVWYPEAVVIKLQTAATGVNREVRLWVSNSYTESQSGAVAQVLPYTAQAPGTTRSYEYSVGVASRAAVSSCCPTGTDPLFEIAALPGWKIRTQVLNLQSGDNFVGAWLYVIEVRKWF